jgi:hypothetical protein
VFAGEKSLWKGLQTCRETDCGMMMTECGGKLWSHLTYCPGICREGLSKTIKACQVIRCPAFKPESSKYNAEVLTT